jgi:uncharacterized protein (UPF0262 family)
VSGNIVAVTLDDSVIRYHNIEIRYERETAITDLLAENRFEPIGAPPGPYVLHMAAVDDRLQLTIEPQAGGDALVLPVGMQSFRRLMKDYFLIWESYSEAMRGATAEQLEAIDMGRRALHNEGAELLMRVLSGKVAMDLDTARRLFTLICVLHIK